MSVCFCRGGPTCCLRASLPVADQTPYTNPGPFKCPDCGTWWAGEHRCPTVTTTTGTVTTGFTVRCNCPPNRGDSYAGNCPIHDVTTTYTQPIVRDWYKPA